MHFLYQRTLLKKNFKNLKVNDIYNSTDANFSESRDENGNLNYLKSKKELKKFWIVK